MLILDVTINLVAFPLLPAPTHFQFVIYLYPFDQSVACSWASQNVTKSTPEPKSCPRWAHLPQRWRTLNELGIGATVLQSQMETLCAKLKVWLSALQRGHNREQTLQTVVDNNVFPSDSVEWRYVVVLLSSPTHKVCSSKQIYTSLCFIASTYSNPPFTTIWVK